MGGTLMTQCNQFINLEGVVDGDLRVAWLLPKMLSITPLRSPRFPPERTSLAHPPLTQKHRVLLLSQTPDQSRTSLYSFGKNNRPVPITISVRQELGREPVWVSMIKYGHGPTPSLILMHEKLLSTHLTLSLPLLLGDATVSDIELRILHCFPIADTPN